MKKIIAFILCLVITATALPLFCSAQNEAPAAITPTEAFSADNIPVSMQEVEAGMLYHNIFYLKNSIGDFDIKIRLSDGSEHSVNNRNPLEIYNNARNDDGYGYVLSDFATYDDYLKAVEKAHQKLREEYDGKPVAFGNAYIKSEDYYRAKREGLNAICVYVVAEVYEYDSTKEKYLKTTSDTLCFEKECVPFYAKITPVSGLPDYFDRMLGYVDLSEAVFDIEYCTGKVKREKAVLSSDYGGTSVFQLDGRNLEYKIGDRSKTVFLYYLDCKYSWEVSTVKETPHEEIIIADCIFEGNILKEIVYSVENCYGQTKSYRKSVTDPRGEVIDTVDGYEIYVAQVEKSRFCSKVYLRAGQTKTETLCPHDFDNFFMNILARIAVFFQYLKDR